MNKTQSIYEMDKKVTELKSNIDIQEFGTLKFFLMTDKPLVTTHYSQYMKYKDCFEQYPTLIREVLNQEGTKIAYRQVIIAKNKSFIDEYLEVEKLDNYKGIYFSLGTLFGFPKTAIDYFINGNEKGNRYRIKYYGLGFICKRADIEQIKKELLEMYGLPITQEDFKFVEF